MIQNYIRPIRCYKKIFTPIKGVNTRYTMIGPKENCSDTDSSTSLTQGLIMSIILILSYLLHFISIVVPASFYSHASGIKTLNGSNLSEWYEQI